EGVVQALAVGVVQQGGGVGEDLRAAGLRGGLGEDLDLAVGVDGEDGQVGELGFGELTDVRGSNEAHSDSSRIVPGAAPRGGGSGGVTVPSRVLSSFLARRRQVGVGKFSPDTPPLPTSATTDTFHDS